MRVAISGIGIAGPALAWWLRQAGHDVLLVEEAPRLRTSGYIIDFWGLGYDIAEWMGVLPRVRSMGYQVQEVRLLDQDGRRRGGFGTEVFARLTKGRFTSVRRSDLSCAIYEALDPSVERLFGNSIVAIDDLGSRVRIELAQGGTREVDLVIGADGLHSTVRRLAFGPAHQFEVPLGYHVAAAEVAGYRPREELVYLSYTAPGRQFSRFSLRDDRTLLFFILHDDYLRGETPSSDAERRATLGRIFRDVSPETAQALAALEGTPELYFDSVSQIRMPSWSKGRVALIGDAAACVSLLAGEGSGLALMEAYVLAGELDRAQGDHAAAFAEYQRLLRPFLHKKQQGARQFASTFAPRTRLGLWLRNTITGLLNLPGVAEYFVGRSLKDDVALPEYRLRRHPA